MDAQRFDLLTKRLGTRRSVLRTLAGSALACGLARLGAEEAAAACNETGKSCNDAGDCCTDVCKQGTCQCKQVDQPGTDK